MSSCDPLSPSNTSMGRRQTAIIGAITSLLVLTPNACVLLALVRSSKLRKNAYTVLVLLKCISDMFLGLFGMFFSAYYVINNLDSSLNRPICTITLHFLVTGIAGSLGQMLLVSVNRLLAASGATTANEFLFSNNRKYLMVAIMNLLLQVYFLATIPFQGYGNIKICSFCSLFRNGNYRANFVLTSVGYSFLYLSVLVVYMCAFIKLRKRFLKILPKQMAKLPENSTMKLVYCANYKYYLRALATIGFLFILLSLLTIPVVVLSILEALAVRIPVFVWTVALGSTLLNSLANPMIYIWRFEELRHELKRMFCVK